MSDADQRWQPGSIRERLDSLARHDRELRRFGASHHRYRLNPVLAVAEVVAFEQKWSVRLPEPYRSFLIEVGDGGAGPYYGLLPLDYGGVRDRIDGPHLAESFPHTVTWNEDSLLPHDEDAYFDDALIAGSLTVADFGCGDTLRLVVTGPARGQIWQDGRPGDYGIWPVAPDFRTWYEDWLGRDR